jgi:hypothetical protein
LNNEFSPGHQTGPKALIPTDQKPAAICNQVTKYIKSFAAGLHSEFLAVYTRLEEVLSELEQTGLVMERAHKQIIARLRAKKAEDSKIREYDDIYDRAHKLHRQEMEMIKNFLEMTLAPADRELAAAIKKSKKTKNIITKLGVEPGGPQYSEAIIATITGFGTLASVSHKVDKALKELGMSVRDYVDSADMREFEKRLDALVDRQAERKPEDFADFLRAAAVLKENFGRRMELTLKSASGGDALGGEMHGAMEADVTLGGDDELGIDKRIKRKVESRKLIVQEFAKRMSKHFNVFLVAVDRVGPQLGRKVPISDKLALLRDLLKQMETVGGVARLEYALIGYWTEAEARQRKESFLNSLRMIIGVLDDILGMEMYRESSSYFSGMREPLRAILDTVDHFTDIMAKKFGGKKKGGVDFETNLEAVEADVNRSTLDLRVAARAFAYFFYIAKIRDNLKQTGKELKAYGEDYTKLLAQAIGARQNQVAYQSKEEIDDLTTNNPPVAGNAPDKEMYDNVLAFLKKDQKTHEEFYRSLEGLDLYMQVFTDAIVNNPDDVKSIGRMLRGIDVIAPFYDEISGNQFAQAFELLPGGVGDMTFGPNEHYYQKVFQADFQGPKKSSQCIRTCRR